MDIFEQIGKKISNASQGATRSAKNFAEVARLNGAISEKKKRISQIYIKIGQSYYENHKEDDKAEELECIAEINGLNAEILKCQESIKHISGITKCQNCGENVSLDSAFCSACGAKTPSFGTTDNGLSDTSH